MGKISWFSILLFFANCTAEQPKNYLAFYFWKTTFEIKPVENALLDSLGCQKIYVKFLDIGKNKTSGEPEPTAILQVSDTTFFFGKKLVPCVFITNETFRGLDEKSVADLAEKTAKLLFEIGSFFPKNPVSAGAEIQFDCDWTATTREPFFLFLKKMKNFLPENVSISATIRLHQFKFPEKTGVPPGERGMLMFYNTGDIENWETENSIFEIGEAKKYLSGAPKNYPLQLDVALPVFSWSVVFRDGVFWKILNNRRDVDFLGNKNFKPLKTNRFEVVSETFFDGILLRPGDQIRVENISPEILRQAESMIYRLPKNEKRTVAFFHLDSVAMAGFRVSDFTFGL